MRLQPLLAIVCITLLGFAACWASDLPPNVICVNGATGDDSNDGSDWNNAVRTLDGDNGALQIAADNPSKNEIWVAGATGNGITYSDSDQSKFNTSPTSTIGGSPDSASGSPPWLVISSGLKLYGGFAGDESNPTLRDPETYIAILNSYGPTVEFDNSTDSVIDGFVFNDAVCVKLVGSASIQVSHNQFSGITGVLAQSSSAQIYDNWFTSMYHGIQTEDSDCAVYNNIILDGWFGLECEGIDASTVSNNTIVGCCDGIYGSPGTSIANNIVAFGTEYGIAATDSSTPLLSHNCVYHNGTGPVWTDYDAIVQHPTDINDSDPLFADAANGDCHLTSGSQCIDAGDNNYAHTGVGTDTDIDGEPRRYPTPGGTVDIGADEYTPLTVTINQASGQPDPTNASPVNFTVTFSEPVTGFRADDITITGVDGAAATVTGSGTTYNVAISLSASGTVVASVPAGVVQNNAGVWNDEATCTDNSVLFDNVVPVLTSVVVDHVIPTSQYLLPLGLLRTQEAALLVTFAGGL